jgi:alpha-beta hydrolase superfamily lysophospholipase
MFHGHGECRSVLLPEAHEFLKMGYNVFMLDFRAHGNSEGEQCLVGMKETADVKAAYDYVKQQGEKQVILYGNSMGAATILKTVHDLDIHPDKLILEKPFATMMDATKGKLRLMHLPEALGTPVMFWGGVLNGEWAFNYKPYLDAEHVSCPVLLQWGRKDLRVSEHETNEIFQNLKGQKKLVVYETAAHESLYNVEPAKWLSETGSFLND